MVEEDLGLVYVYAFGAYFNMGFPETFAVVMYFLLS